MHRFLKYFIHLGTIILLFVIVWGCGVKPTLKEGTEGIYVRLPFVRILLDNSQKSVKLNSTTAFSMECLRGDQSYVYHGSKPITVVNDNGKLSIWMDRNKVGDNYTELLMAPRGNRGLVEYNKTKYRGMFRVITQGRKLQLINVVHMDDYLKGVVPPEIGFFKEDLFEAIKAQSVAARTYAMSHIDQFPGEEFDMRADVSDQVYHGVNVERDIVSQAIEETRGFVMKYRGELINAYYHSTCGGYTDDIEEVWDKRDMPYLRAVPDSGYCSWSKYYNWDESYTHDQLKLMIEQYLSSERGRTIRIGRIEDIYVVSTTNGGRVAELVVKTKDREYRFGRDKIRWVFKRGSNPELILESARFKVNLKRGGRDGTGKIEKITLTGGGYGHGVGMCQCGAIGMSRAGKDFQDILKTYYSSIDIVKMY